MSDPVKVSYQWYPNDWKQSDTFLDIDDPLLRYFYREIIDLLYLNSGYWEESKTRFEKAQRLTISDEKWAELRALFRVETRENVTVWTLESVLKRIDRRTVTSPENGQKGGHPGGPNKPKINLNQQPNKNQTENLTEPKKPIDARKERKIEYKLTDSVGKSVSKDKAHTSPAQPLPLWAVGFRDGRPDFGVWRKYSGWITRLLKTPGKLATNEAAINACVYFWPYDLGENLETFKVELSKFELGSNTYALEEMRDCLSDGDEKFFSDPVKFSQGSYVK